MKTMMLMAVAALGLTAGAQALLANDDCVEIGDFTTESGVHVSAVYLVKQGEYTEVYLTFPDGRKIQVDVEKGTSARTLDRSLQHIIDEQKQ